ncbi:MAG: hypothetical protein AB8G17_00025 [Gammaproteobacteria bacterium]
MHDPLFSQQWYRVRALAPRVRPDTINSRHIYRGQTWFVLKGLGGGSVRINAPAHQVLSEFDGERNVGEIWETSLVSLGDDAPTQDEMIQLLGDLFDASILDFEHTSDLDQLFVNRSDRSSAESKSRYGNPLFMRFALFNPNKLALALLPYSGWFFSRAVFALWLMAMVIAAVTVVYTWGPLTQSVTTDLVTSRGLLILWFVFPLMKLVHEMAHAVAVRRFGGEVHEGGIAMLVLLPVPYVDASDSGRFPNKYHRMTVASAGILIETTLACIGLAVWLIVEPGLVRDIALNVFVTGSVSSLLFNGNPLLKFDAYYVLADALEMPNLAARASRYPIYLLQRYVLRLDVRSPAIAPGERRWLLSYGVIAALYRLFLAFAICLYVASKFFFVGIVLAMWALVAQLGKPLWTLSRFLLFDPRIVQQRWRVNTLAALCASLIAFGLFVVQVPHVTAVRGVIWPTEQAVVRSRSDCFVDAVLTANGRYVPVDAPLIRCKDAREEATLAGLRADYLIARAALDASRDRVDRQLYRSELRLASDLLDQAEERNRRSIVTSDVGGEVYFPADNRLTGRYLKQGAVIGYVLNRDHIAIRTLLPQERIELLDDTLESVDVRRLRGAGIVEATSIVRRVPAATDRLAIAALGDQGGGDLMMRADDQESAILARPAFELELTLPPVFVDTLIGEPVELRFSHGSASTATILYRKLQLLLLSQFHV